MESIFNFCVYFSKPLSLSSPSSPFFPRKRPRSRFRDQSDQSKSSLYVRRENRLYTACIVVYKKIRDNENTEPKASSIHRHVRKRCAKRTQTQADNSPAHGSRKGACEMNSLYDPIYHTRAKSRFWNSRNRRCSIIRIMNYGKKGTRAYSFSSGLYIYIYIRTDFSLRSDESLKFFTTTTENSV